MLPASERVFVCLTHCEFVLFHVADETSKELKKKKTKSATELAVHVLRLLLFVCAYVNGFLPHL